MRGLRILSQHVQTSNILTNLAVNDNCYDEVDLPLWNNQDIFNYVPVSFSLCAYRTPKYPSKLQLGTIPKTHAPKMTACKMYVRSR
ncbi:hypothetical protein VN97_g10216 [Penicillium thymicola]|uniref:Uncharacterized protein n=1 Tax=Penicillium thymicola TaxID=293382 RepID=A0AAI9X443_PENTH|nr:hypothetical protein VN97_g10216 [Penicillium thymicola]